MVVCGAVKGGAAILNTVGEAVKLHKAMDTQQKMYSRGRFLF